MKIRVFFLMATASFAGCAKVNSDPASKPNLLAIPPVPNTASAQGSLEIPSSKVIAEFERASLTKKSQSELNDVVRVPAVEIADLSCVQSSLNRYDCR